MAKAMPAAVAVVGCGGKTTLIEALADEFRDRKVLISPTTKILPPHGNIVNRVTLEESSSHIPAAGIQCLGALNEATGKLEALPPPVLEGMIRQYDLALLEADGSNGLPCKGWREDEPAVPEYCDFTLGVVTPSAVGKPAGAETTLRLKEFTAITGLEAGRPITVQALARMVCAKDGMFRRNAGKLCVFVNGAEDAETAARAEELLRYIRRESPGRFSLLAYGSALRNEWVSV